MLGRWQRRNEASFCGIVMFPRIWINWRNIPIGKHPWGSGGEAGWLRGVRHGPILCGPLHPVL